MKKHKSLALLAFATIVLSACNQNEDQQTTGNWDGNDYNTGRDTMINNHPYYYSSYGYWYWYNSGQVTRYYPRTGYSQTLPADEHRRGVFLLAPEHIANGGASEDPVNFGSGHAGTVQRFGNTARGVSSGEGFGSSAGEGGERGS
jgi:hypothetical protein